MALGTPLLAARNRSEFERALGHATTDRQLERQLVQVVHTVFELDRRLPNLDPIIDDYAKRLGDEHRWKIRQIFNMSLELMLHLRESGISLGELIEGLEAIDVNESVLSRASRENFVCASAVACAVEYPSIDISDIVRGELVDRWYQTATAVRGEADPFQRSIDALLAREASRLPEVQRLTYTLSPDATAVRIWAVCADTIEQQIVERLEHDLGGELRVEAAFHCPGLEWSAIGIRPASARGPAEDLVRRFATLDELFAPRPEKPDSAPRAGWSITPTARARIAGHERTLYAIAERLTGEVSKHGYRIVDISLTAHVSPEAPSDEVLLELGVADLPDAAARIELWGELSDSLSEDNDPFVVERLSIVVRRITD